MVKTLVAKAKEKGVEIRLETPVKKILKNGDRIGGVIAEDKSGKTMQVNAKAVIIATGGYANNKEMIKKYTGFDLGRDLFYANVDIELTGDGIQMAWEVGAAEEGLGVLILNTHHTRARDCGYTVTILYRANPTFGLINKESASVTKDIVGNWPFAGNAIAKQKNRIVSLFSMKIRRNILKKRVWIMVWVLLFYLP